LHPAYVQRGSFIFWGVPKAQRDLEPVGALPRLNKEIVQEMGIPFVTGKHPRLCERPATFFTVICSLRAFLTVI
jgi:hypothetical protein